MVAVADDKRTNEASKSEKGGGSVFLDHLLKEVAQPITQRDPFKILGLAYDVTADDVRQAVKKHLIDYNPARPDMTERFGFESLNKAFLALLWARDKAVLEVTNGKASERASSALNNADPAEATFSTTGFRADHINSALSNGNGAKQGPTGGSGVGAYAGDGAQHGAGHGAGHAGGGYGGGRGPVPPSYNGPEANDPFNRNHTWKDITRSDAFRDPLQAFVFACRPSVLQGLPDALAKAQMARLCHVASKQLGHRMNARELHYAIVGRDDKNYMESGNSWDTRDIRLAIAAGRIMDQEKLVQITVRNDIQKRMREMGGAFGNVGLSGIDAIYKGIALARGSIGADGYFDVRPDNIMSRGVVQKIMEFNSKNLEPGKKKDFGNGIELTAEGIDAFRNTISSVGYEALEKVDHYEIERLWGVSGTREDWSKTSIGLAHKLLKEMVYDNGLVQGKFHLFLGMLKSLAEGASGWRA